MNLDTLPIELIWRIFDCLSSYDLFFSLRNVNRQLNVSITSYPRHRLNFYSIPKSHFDLICRCICPRQVISLHLFQDVLTPGQLELFSSIYGGIQQFINLQSFELQSFGRNSFIDSVLADLHKLNHLSSLQLSLENPMLVLCKESRLGRMFKLDIRLFDDRFTMPLSGLRHLTLTYCTFKQLGMIFREAEYLISLDVVLQPDDDCPSNDNFEQIPPPSVTLTRLTIEISYYSSSMTRMEQFLTKMPHLKHLTIKGHGNIDLVDGLKWQPLVAQLTTFNFDFKIFSSQITNDLLDTFRSAFWLVEKRWFIVFDKKQSQLFTTPLLASQKIDFPSSNMSYHSSAANIEQTFAEHVENLSIQDSTVLPIHCYQRIKSLELHCTNISSLETLPLIVNLATVEHLLIAKTSLSVPTMINDLHMLIPCLHRLTIDDAHPLLSFDSPKTIFQQIRTLELTYKDTDRKVTASTVNISHLCRLFSHVEHLTMRTNSFEDMANVIDGLEHLFSVTFNVEYFSDISSIIDLPNQWFASDTRPRRIVNENDYAFRIGIDCIIYLWM